MDVKAPWKRMTMKEAIKTYGKYDVDKMSEEQMITELKTKSTISHDKLKDPSKGLLISYMFEEFVSFGGVGIEVATGSHSSADIERFKNVSMEYDFKASRGSDFHSPSESRHDVGRAPYLPDCLLPIWANMEVRG